MAPSATKMNEEVLDWWERWRSEEYFFFVVLSYSCFCLCVCLLAMSCFGLIFKLFFCGDTAGLRGGYGGTSR